MKACIRRGAHQIGGSCIELESGGQRIVLDVGVPLDAEPDPDLVPMVPGLITTDPSLLGIFVSHAHQDHFGLLPFVVPGLRVFMGEAASRMLSQASLFWRGAAGLGPTEPVRHKEPIDIGPFRVTPYLVDHSAYDAFALLVEADGDRLFYSGDLRAHGAKGKLFEQLVREGIPGLDALLLEGTTLGRPPSDKYLTEAELQEPMSAIFRETPGMVLVCVSGMNIDRLVTIYRAAHRAGRTLILDMYAASVLRATDNPNLPQAGWRDVRVYLPKSQKRAIIRAEAFELASSFKPYRVYPEQLRELASRAVMLFRTSMIEEVEEADCLDGAGLVYSLWPGYLERDKDGGLVEWLTRRGIPLSHCHTSGHASPADLKRLVLALRPGKVVPVHSEVPEAFVELIGSVSLKADGEWWAVSESTVGEN